MSAKDIIHRAATLRAYLNGQSLDVRYDPHTASSWTLDMSLASNTTNTLAVYADHPSGRFTTNHANTFTVSAGSFDKEDSQYDGGGNVTNRVWKNASGQVVKTQALTWDAFGRLVKVTERDASNNGFNFVSVFDGLGRQAQTIETAVTNNVLLVTNPAPVIVSYTYDPQVEFLIVGITVSQGNGSRQDSLAYGPDISGVYGGMHGVGGLETITTAPYNQTAIAVNDAFGNIIAAVTNGAMAWNSSRLNLYAPVEGYAPPRLSLSVPTYASLAWRTRSMTAAGFVQLGARPYDFARRAFLSADLLGHDSDAALNTAFAGNPAAFFDAKGRAPQISGFSYSPTSPLSVQYGTPGMGVDYTTPQWSWNTSLVSSQSPIYPFDYNWGLQGFNNNLLQQNYAWQKAHPQPQIWQPDPGRAASADMEIVDAVTIVSGIRLVTAIPEALLARSAEGLAARTGAEAAANPTLYWHGSADAVAARNAGGVFVGDVGAGGKYWATKLPLEDTGIGNWKLGGNFELTSMSSKGGFDATYTLGSEESALFNRAWGTDFSWNPYSYWKGMVGQYYYQPVAATAGQRLLELGTGGLITGAGFGTAYGILNFPDSSPTLSKHSL